VDECLDAVWALVETRGYVTRSAKDDD
jgi:hypothetical protein